jgi:hypothetical protein
MEEYKTSDYRMANLKSPWTTNDYEINFGRELSLQDVITILKGLNIRVTIHNNPDPIYLEMLEKGIIVPLGTEGAKGSPVNHNTVSELESTTAPQLDSEKVAEEVSDTKYVELLYGVAGYKAQDIAKVVGASNDNWVLVHVEGRETNSDYAPNVAYGLSLLKESTEAEYIKCQERINANKINTGSLTLKNVIYVDKGNFHRRVKTDVVFSSEHIAQISKFMDDLRELSKKDLSLGALAKG